MENKINVAELLKEYPKGMELDCTLYDNCTYEGIEDVGYINILVNTPSGRIKLTKEGCFIRHDKNAKCVIFPKGKNTWEGFHRPFKDGDIVADENGNIAIYRCGIRYNKKLIDYYCGYRNKDDTFLIKKDVDSHFGYIEEKHLATEEEKQKLFKAIKDNGYKWNSETKTLEKLIIPKFKIGDTITNGKTTFKIKHIFIENGYCYYFSYDNPMTRLDGKYQDDWELAPNKFDINSLVPFESKVLVRHTKDSKWTGSFFSFLDRDLHSYCYKFVTTAGKSYPMMIPYKGNEHLLGKTDDCDEFYKNWEELWHN